MNKVFIGILITTGALIFTLFRAVILLFKFRNQKFIKISISKINGLDMY